MVEPAPVQTYILLDERDDSINDGYFVVTMDGFSPSEPTARDIVDLPSDYHNGAGGFSFADGHAEIHRWLEAGTKPRHVLDFHLSNTGPQPSPNNRDILWLQERATGKQ